MRQLSTLITLLTEQKNVIKFRITFLNGLYVKIFQKVMSNNPEDVNFENLHKYAKQKNQKVDPRSVAYIEKELAITHKS